MQKHWSDDETLIGPISGLGAALGIVLEALVAARVIDPSAVAALLQAKIDELSYDPTDQNVDAIQILKVIQEPLISPLRHLGHALPKGSA